MSVRLSAALAALVLLAGCSTATPTKAPVPAVPAAPVAAAPAPAAPADDNLNAVAWSQTAIEHDLIYLQTYPSTALR
jgi:acid phosphatase